MFVAVLIIVVNFFYYYRFVTINTHCRGSTRRDRYSNYDDENKRYYLANCHFAECYSRIRSKRGHIKDSIAVCAYETLTLLFHKITPFRNISQRLKGFNEGGVFILN